MAKRKKILKLDADTVRAFLALGSFIITFLIGCVLLIGIFFEGITANKETLETAKYVFAWFSGQTGTLIGFYIANREK
jgi:cytochrome bd-type quinol oxidase subunit 2